MKLTDLDTHLIIPVNIFLMVLFLIGSSIGNAVAGGVANSNVTQDSIHQTVCVPGWTETIRPPSSYTQAWEKANGGNIDTVVDHKLLLCAGKLTLDEAQRMFWQ